MAVAGVALMLAVATAGGGRAEGVIEVRALPEDGAAFLTALDGPRPGRRRGFLRWDG
ncbi:MAG: hypothetical protein U0531_03760 [Dehalococcoidia bacterium]